jgi:formylglycine-generating enzyme required for sulfatase activity
MARARREELIKARVSAPAPEPPKSVSGQQTAAVVVPPDMLAVPAVGPCSWLATVFSMCTDAPLTDVQERGLKPKDSFRECADCPEMVVVPAGRFTMGSPAGEKDRGNDEGPQHDVTIAKPFAVGKLHVTVAQYKAFVEATGYEKLIWCHWSRPGFAQQGAHPVVCVLWHHAEAYVAWLARKTGKSYRLLSEAEWEYAARGRTTPGAYPRFWFGDDEKERCRYGNFWEAGRKDAPCNDRYARTSPAGHYEPNAFGLYDMAGNAWQWTADCHHADYNGAPVDGSAWTSGCDDGITRVYRGGLRAAERGRPIIGYVLNGFRVARTLAR